MAFDFTLMRLLSLVICFGLCLLRNIDNQEQHNLVIINESNAQKYISMYNDFFIFIHSPWCKWSQRFNSNLIKVNEMLKYEAQANYLSLFDVTLSNINILKDFLPSNIDPQTITYPKLIYLQNGIVNDIYRGMFEVDNSYLWIKRKIQRNSLKVTLMQVFQTKVKFDRTSFMFFGDYSVANSNFQVFNKVSNEVVSTSFYHTDENILYNYLNPNKNFTVGFLKYGVLNDTFSGNLTFEALKQFISSKTNKNFFEKVNEETIQEIFIQRNPAVVFFCSKYDEEYIFYYRTFKRIASDMATKVYKPLFRNLI
jgi:hypothetical protein